MKQRRMILPCPRLQVRFESRRCRLSAMRSKLAESGTALLSSESGNRTLVSVPRKCHAPRPWPLLRLPYKASSKNRVVRPPVQHLSCTAIARPVLRLTTRPRARWPACWCLSMPSTGPAAPTRRRFARRWRPQIWGQTTSSCPGTEPERRRRPGRRGDRARSGGGPKPAMSSGDRGGARPRRAHPLLSAQRSP